MSSPSSVEKDKRTLVREGSDAAPPRAKAKSKQTTGDNDSDDEELRQQVEEPSISDLFKLMMKVDARTAKMEGLRTEFKEFKNKVTKDISDLRSRVDTTSDECQAKIATLEGTIGAMDKRIRDVETSSSSSKSAWNPSQLPSPPPRDGSTTAGSNARYVSPDELVIIGFERDTHKSVRTEVAKKMLDKLQVSGTHFTVVPKFLHSNLCFVIRKNHAPQAVVSQIIEEFNANPSASNIEHEGKVYKIALRKPIAPGRLRRNAILKQACEYLKEKSPENKDDIDICWQNGAVKFKTDIVFSVDYEGGKAYFEPLLTLGISKDQLSKALEVQVVQKPKRL